MREIKFRAWVESEDAGHRIAQVNRISFIGNFSYVMLEDDDYEYQIDNCYLMQFTGLHDKNGKEIYEGDILKRTINMRNYADCDGTQEEIHIVMYFGYGFEPFVEVGNYNNEFEVIGNIYENPELLEAQ